MTPRLHRTPAPTPRAAGPVLTPTRRPGWLAAVERALLRARAVVL